MDIVMKPDKTLIKKNPVNLYQGESNCDTIRFLIPQEYNGLVLSDFVAELTYIKPNKETVKTELNFESELFEDQLLQANFVIDSDFTAYTGVIIMQLCFTKDNYVLSSSIVAVDIK